jgi:hypothetical protein
MTKMTGSPPGATEWFQHARLMRKQQLCKLAQLGALVSRISHLASAAPPTSGSVRRGRFMPRSVKPAVPWWMNNFTHYIRPWVHP